MRIYSAIEIIVCIFLYAGHQSKTKYINIYIYMSKKFFLQTVIVGLHFHIVFFLKSFPSDQGIPLEGRKNIIDIIM